MHLSILPPVVFLSSFLEPATDVNQEMPYLTDYKNMRSQNYKKMTIVVLIIGNDFSYQINEVLGIWHIIICGVTIRSCQYFYDYHTQTKYIKLFCDFPHIYIRWWRVTTEIY